MPASAPALRTDGLQLVSRAPEVALILARPYAACPPTFWNDPPAKTDAPSPETPMAHTV